jgi:hypothetical protein
VLSPPVTMATTPERAPPAAALLDGGISCHLAGDARCEAAA